MHDYGKAAKAIIKYHEDFRPDFQTTSVAPARVFEKLGLNLVEWPGGTLADETPWQYIESEYMKEDEYDALIADPEVYFRRSLLPRFGSAFKALANPAPFTDMMEATTMLFSILPYRRSGSGRGHAEAGGRRPGVPELAHDHRRGRR